MALRSGGGENIPPPSTLAAQLVNNFSASARSSRSDENNELRRLSATIQAVEKDPELLKSPEDQLKHNHLLTYVFIRAVLDNIRLEDPLIDPTVLRAEILKAINFLRLIVKETPSVLSYTQQYREFDARGEEPLWIWLFPKLLRFLGHPRCLEATHDIEEFFEDVLMLLGFEGALGDISSAIILYFRQIFDGSLCTAGSAQVFPLTVTSCAWRREGPPSGRARRSGKSSAPRLQHFRASTGKRRNTYNQEQHLHNLPRHAGSQTSRQYSRSTVPSVRQHRNILFSIYSLVTKTMAS